MLDHNINDEDYDDSDDNDNDEDYDDSDEDYDDSDDNVDHDHEQHVNYVHSRIRTRSILSDCIKSISK